MTAKTLEQEAREAAKRIRGEHPCNQMNDSSGLQLPDNYFAPWVRETNERCWLDGYAAATKEAEALLAEVNDWRESARKAEEESCGDEVHCSCVGLMRKEIAALLARVAELEEMVPRWINQSVGGGVAEVLRLTNDGWVIASGKYDDKGQWWSLVVPPIRLPVPRA